jgi:magnesium chelatase family protein
LVENSAQVRQRVIAARNKQKSRSNLLNAGLDQEKIKQFCRIDEAIKNVLQQAVEKLQLSARAYFKILKVARTIADLANREDIEEGDVLEALLYRGRIFGD